GPQPAADSRSPHGHEIAPVEGTPPRNAQPPPLRIIRSANARHDPPIDPGRPSKPEGPSCGRGPKVAKTPGMRPVGVKMAPDPGHRGRGPSRTPAKAVLRGSDRDGRFLTTT